MSRRTQDNRRGRSGRGGQNNSGPPVQTVTPVSSSEMTGMATSAVPRLAGAASTANVADRRTDAAATVSDILLTGGAGIVNPQVQTGIDQFTNTANRQITPFATRATAATLAIAKLQAELADPNLKASRRAQIENKLLPAQQRKLDTANRTIQGLRAAVTDYRTQQADGQQTLTDLMAERFPEAQQALDRSQPYLDQMGQLGAAGERLAGALGQGFEAGGVGYSAATGSQAARQANVDAGRLGDSLMGEAMRRVDLRGRLDAEGTRDAIQAARQGFAARGLATGGASLGAELLNRDRYSRQRAFEDLGFASGVQQQDIGRQFQNQATQQQREIFNAGQMNQVNLTNAEAAMRAQVANEEARRLGTQMNSGMLGEAYNLQQGVIGEGLRGVGLGSQLASAANPYNQALALYGSSGTNTGSQALPGAVGLATNYAANQLSAQGFNANMGMSQYLGDQNLQAARMAAGATQNAGMMSLVGGVGGGALVGVGLAL